MIQLKNILQSKYIIYVLLLAVFLFRLLNISYTSKFIGNETKIYGYINNINIDKSKIRITLDSKEKIIANYYVNTIDELNDFLKNYNLGDYIELTGEINEPKTNTNFYMFNYKEYLKYQEIYYVFSCNKIKNIKKNTNILYLIKQKIINRINNLKYSQSYVNSFVLGDDSYILDEEKEYYRSIGISHLFAISGMHIGFIISFLSFVLKKLNSKVRLILIIIFMLFYLFLINFSITAIRACLQALYIYINRKSRIFSSVEIVLLVFFTLVIYNPNFIYYMSFQISIIVSFFIAFYSKKINKDKKLIEMFQISLVSFVSTFPIIIYYFNDINLLSVLLNIIFIPIVSYILFPLCIITFIFPIFDYILYLSFCIFNDIVIISNSINIFKISFATINIIIYLIYYLLILLFYKYKKSLIIGIILCIIHLNILYFNNNNYIYFFDVGQGDSALIILKNKANIVIDTGGKINYCSYELGCNSNNLVNSLLIPTFKKLGIKKIDYLILTHGDYDHMGEAINLVNNFKVDKVIFNCGEYNDLEQELIKLLDNKKIKYYSCIKELKIDENKLQFLQTKEYDNENDNSNVIYTELSNYKFLFMGDASSTTEKEINSKYKLPNIDVLKVGHHGSKTSSSEYFINSINPKYSIISVGKNNRYGHPNKEALDNLNNSKIYRIDQDGSISFKIKNNKMQIETCI